MAEWSSWPWEMYLVGRQKEEELRRQPPDLSLSQHSHRWLTAAAWCMRWKKPARWRGPLSGFRFWGWGSPFQWVWFFNVTCFRAISGVASNWGIFGRVRKIAKKRMLALSCLSVRLCARPQAAWNNSAAIGRILMEFESICRMYFEKVQVSLKSDKNNGYFTWRPMYIFDHISLSSSYNGRWCRENSSFITIQQE